MMNEAILAGQLLHLLLPLNRICTECKPRKLTYIPPQLNFFLDTPAHGIFQKSCNYYASRQHQEKKPSWHMYSELYAIYIHCVTQKKDNCAKIRHNGN